MDFYLIGDEEMEEGLLSLQETNNMFALDFDIRLAISTDEQRGLSQNRF